MKSQYGAPPPGESGALIQNLGHISQTAVVCRKRPVGSFISTILLSQLRPSADGFPSVSWIK